MSCALAPGSVGIVMARSPESSDLDGFTVKPAGAAMSALSLVPVTGTAVLVFTTACAWPGIARPDVVPGAAHLAIAKTSMTAGTAPVPRDRATDGGSLRTTRPQVAQQSTINHAKSGTGRLKSGDTGNGM
jgi:hypothetical protein